MSTTDSLPKEEILIEAMIALHHSGFEPAFEDWRRPWRCSFCGAPNRAVRIGSETHDVDCRLMAMIAGLRDMIKEIALCDARENAGGDIVDEYSIYRDVEARINSAEHRVLGRAGISL